MCSHCVCMLGGTKFSLIFPTHRNFPQRLFLPRVQTVFGSWKLYSIEMPTENFRMYYLNLQLCMCMSFEVLTVFPILWFIIRWKSAVGLYHCRLPRHICIWSGWFVGCQVSKTSENYCLWTSGFVSRGKKLFYLLLININLVWIS